VSTSKLAHLARPVCAHFKAQNPPWTRALLDRWSSRGVRRSWLGVQPIAALDCPRPSACGETRGVALPSRFLLAARADLPEGGGGPSPAWCSPIDLPEATTGVKGLFGRRSGLIFVDRPLDTCGGTSPVDRKNALRGRCVRASLARLLRWLGFSVDGDESVGFCGVLGFVTDLVDRRSG